MTLLNYRNNFIHNRHVTTELIHRPQAQFQPVLSIVIPTFGRSNLILEAINSALDQTFDQPYDVIIINNNSKDDEVNDLKAMAKELNSNILFLYNNSKNIGMIGNWNRCIEVSHAEWLIILHDDDIMHPRLLEEIWGSRCGNALVSSLTYTFRDKLPSEYIELKQNIRDIDNSSVKQRIGKRLKAFNVLKDVPVTASGTLLHKESSIKIGGYDLHLWPHFDYLFSAKYIILFGGILVKRPLLFYRLHDNASSRPDNYIKFHRAKYVIRKSIASSLISNWFIKYWILKLIAILKWLEFNNSLRRYLAGGGISCKRCDRYIKLFFTPSRFWQIINKAGEILLPFFISRGFAAYEYIKYLGNPGKRRECDNLNEWMASDGL